MSSVDGDWLTARRALVNLDHEFRTIRRVSPNRLSATRWTTGDSIGSADTDQELIVDDVRVNEEEAPDNIAHVLNLTSMQKVYVRRRRFLIADHPIQIATSYYPAHLVTGTQITEKYTGAGGSYARLHELGYSPARFREELCARMPTTEEAHQLELAPNTPVIVVLRTAYTADDLPVEVNEMVLDARSYVLEYRFAA